MWNGEVTPVITVADGRVASRSIRLDERRGDWRGLRFTYGKNMAGCTRTVLERVYSRRDARITGYGVPRWSMVGGEEPAVDVTNIYESTGELAVDG